MHAMYVSPVYKDYSIQHVRKHVMKLENVMHFIALQEPIRPPPTHTVT